MVTNNLLIRLAGRSAGEIEKAKQTLLGMKGKIPELRDIRVETDLRGPEKSGFDIMLITRFDSLDGLASYLKHPAHIEAAGYITGVIDESASLCYGD
jgi:hypothetical protein